MPTPNLNQAYENQDSACYSQQRSRNSTERFRKHENSQAQPPPVRASNSKREKGTPKASADVAVGKEEWVGEGGVVAFCENGI